MNSTDLSAEQLEKIQAQLGPSVDYLRELAKRAQQTFPPDDSLRQHIEAAWDAVFALRIRLHYAACEAANPGTTGPGAHSRAGLPPV